MSSNETQEEMVTIPKHEYIELQKRDFELMALEAGGVDNWSWYGEHMEEYKKMCKEAGIDP